MSIKDCLKPNFCMRIQDWYKPVLCTCIQDWYKPILCMHIQDWLKSILCACIQDWLKPIFPLVLTRLTRKSNTLITTSIFSPPSIKSQFLPMMTTCQGCQAYFSAINFHEIHQIDFSSSPEVSLIEHQTFPCRENVTFLVNRKVPVFARNTACKMKHNDRITCCSYDCSVQHRRSLNQSFFPWFGVSCETKYCPSY